jgi:hypothetical protein
MGPGEKVGSESIVVHRNSNLLQILRVDICALINMTWIFNCDTSYAALA